MSIFNMEIYVWPSDWGLPSIDVKSLQIMAFVKFSSAPVRFRSFSSPWPFTKTSCIPTFLHGPNISITDIRKMFEYLKNQNYNCDSNLSLNQMSDIQAYSFYLEEKLYPALLLSWWIDQKNYEKLTRPWYAKVLPLPLNYIIPGHHQRSAVSFLQDLYNIKLQTKKETNEESQIFNSDTVESAVERLLTIKPYLAIISNAEECLTFLSHRLEDNDFFFGKSPCSLDAILYGYLAPVLKVPFPNPKLQEHLKTHENLCNYVKRISQNYFPKTCEGASFLKKKNASSEHPHKWRNIIASGLVATFAMGGYCLATGIIERNGMNLKLSLDACRNAE